jgi:hypothetical protein
VSRTDSKKKVKGRLGGSTLLDIIDGMHALNDGMHGAFAGRTHGLDDEKMHG